MFKSYDKLEEIFGKDDAVAGIVLSLCAAMFDNGVKLVHIGGLMRMLGVPNDVACEHDEEAIELPDNFYEQLEEMETELESFVPASATVH